MPEELGSSLKYLSNIEINDHGDLRIYSGECNININSPKSVYLSVALSGWGKVGSARAATRVISNVFKDKSVDVLFFFGVAGAIDSDLKQGDIVVASKLVQHDMDARPIFNQYVIPALNQKILSADLKLLDWSYSILNEANLKEFTALKLGLLQLEINLLVEKMKLKDLKMILRIY